MTINSNTKQYLSLGLLLFSLSVSFKARTEDMNREQLARQALATAIDDVKARLAKIGANQRLSYLKTKDDNEGTVRTSRYTPTSQTAGEWWAEDRKGSDNNTEQKRWDDDALLTLESSDLSQAVYKSEDKNAWLFDMPSQVQLNVDSETASQEKKEELEGVFRTEMRVAKSNSRFESFRLYSVKPFSPGFAVKIKRFEQVNELAPAWPDGPLVTIKQEERVKGTIGFLVGIDDQTSVTNSEFELIKIN